MLRHLECDISERQYFLDDFLRNFDSVSFLHVPDEVPLSILAGAVQDEILDLFQLQFVQLSAGELPLVLF